jgi:hypothetical protein
MKKEDQKLLYKALCGDLPYDGLKIYDSCSEDIFYLYGLDKDAEECVHIAKENGVVHTRQLEEVKPALRPLSDLTKEITHNGKTFVPIKELFRMIAVDIHAHMNSYKEARLRAGLSSKISIDPCIYPEIVFLWSKGVVTYGSCCGHNNIESMVNVSEESIRIMLDLGYTQNYGRKDTFRLKSVLNVKI